MAKTLDKKKWSTRDVIWFLVLILGISTTHLVTRYDIRNDVMRDLTVLFVKVEYLQKDVDELKNTISKLFEPKRPQENINEDEDTIFNNDF